MKIQTLSDRQNLGFWAELAQAIPYIISGLTSLFGGTQRRELTSADWNYIVPFSGNLYDKIKANLQSRIKYDVDLTNTAIFTLAFAVTNGPGLGYPNTDQGHQAFYNELANERKANGVQGISVNLPANQALPADVSSYDRQYITQFPLYFYGAGTQSGTVVPINPQTGQPISQSSFINPGGSMDWTTILLVGAGIYFVSQTGKKKNG